MKPKISILDHTADAGVKIIAKNLPDLFKNAASAFYNILGCPDKKTAQEYKSFLIKEPTMEILLVTFLNELNFYITSRQILLSPLQNIEIVKTEQEFELSFKAGINPLEAQFLGELTEIKAVTYHQLNIIRDGKNFKTSIIFDL